MAAQQAHASDPQWYRDAIIYELHVRAFADGNGDGIGDFTGLLSKLDYLTDLGVTAIWLLPFYPSPLRDDGYDIADFKGVHPAYGDLRTFKKVLAEAHRRDLRVITELVLNHTSDQHAWFQRARRAPEGSVERDFYVWSDDPEKYSDARIIFEDFESSNWTWDPVAGAYFWHRFYSHQPDLNYDNPAVIEAVYDVLHHWMDMGVDGVRLDAVPYLFEREGTNCENLPETHQFLKDLRAHIDERYGDRMLLAEANQWPEDAFAYFGDGDECHMNFHFPVMPRLFMSVQKEDRLPIIDILEQTPELPEGCQWAMFLRNHDELTLEMVTDEERDYMYRAYASDPQMRVNLGIRRRLAPLLNNDRRKIELLNALLFSLPGTPVLYYGEEIGMGDNVYLGDRDSVRTPMQWTPDRNAGFSTANPHQLFLPAVIEPEYHFQGLNVETQRAKPTSLLSWTRQLLALRRKHPVLGRGDIEFLDPDNPHVLAFLRDDPETDDPPFLVVANLSRLAQHVELDLRDHLGATPVEAFGHTRFSPVGELPYYLTLHPYGFFWFSLEPRSDQGTGDTAELSAGPSTVVSRNRKELTRALSRYVQSRRWFGGKGRAVVRQKGVDLVGLGRQPAPTLVMLELTYADGDPELYSVPILSITGQRAADVLLHHPEVVIARLGGDDEDPELLIDALADAESATELMRAVSTRRQLTSESGTISIDLPNDLRARLRRDGEDAEEIRVIGAEQSNSSVIVGSSAIAKVIRQLHSGENPDVELGRHLTRQGEFEQVAKVLGSVTWTPKKGDPHTLAIVSEYVPNEGDAWQHYLDDVSRHFEELMVAELEPPAAPRPTDPIATARPAAARDKAASEEFGGFVESVDLLGRRTAQMHRALADSDDADMRPERFTALTQRSLYQGVRSQVRSVLSELRRARTRLGDSDLELAERVLDHGDQLIELLEPLRGDRLGGVRMRIHGDFHLGQALWTGKDFVIVDFEGEPARPISERRLRRSPLADVAGMCRSFGYAAHTAVRDQIERGLLPEHADDRDVGASHEWAAWWQDAAGVVYLAGYLEEMADTELLPTDPEQTRDLLVAHLLEKATYEVRYELRYRPSWLSIPLKALLEQVNHD